jgi:hypothetical protein
MNVLIVLLDACWVLRGTDKTRLWMRTNGKTRVSTPKKVKERQNAEEI